MKFSERFRHGVVSYSIAVLYALDVLFSSAVIMESFQGPGHVEGKKVIGVEEAKHKLCQ